MICEICKKRESKGNLHSSIKKYCNTFDIHNVCEECQRKARDLYISDVESFIMFLEEQRNPTTLKETLRKFFGLSVDLMNSDLEVYESNMDKYASFLEDTLLFFVEEKLITDNQILQKCHESNHQEKK